MKKHVFALLFALLLVEPMQNAFAFYNPTAGRWLGRDPLEEKGGLNLYAFCKNNPITRVDTDGRCELDITDASAIASVIAGFTCGATSSIYHDFSRGENINWTAALGWGVGGAAGGLVMNLWGAGSLLGGASATGTYSLLETAVINLWAGTLVGIGVGFGAATFENARDLMSEDRYEHMQNWAISQYGGSLTSSDLDLADIMF